MEGYRFDDDAYRNLGAAGVDWRDALHVLTAPAPRVRHHVGAVLRVAAPAGRGRADEGGRGRGWPVGVGGAAGPGG